MKFAAYIVMSLGLAAWTSFYLIGSYVDKQGILREPFFLVPAGILLVLSGFLLLLIDFFRALWQRRRRQD